MYTITENSVLSFDRKRICPNCITEHIVSHRSRVFCCDKCADDFHNDARWLRTHNQTSLSQPKSIVFISTVAGAKTGAVANSIVPSIPKGDATIDPLEEENKNKLILDSLNIDSKRGSYYYIDDLLRMGVIFNAGITAKLYNIAPEHQCTYIVLGRYKMYSVDYGIVLISKQ